MHALTHRRRYAQERTAVQNGVGPQGIIGATLQGRQIKDSAKGYRQIEVYPSMHRQKVGQYAPDVRGKDWGRPPQRSQYGWQITDLRAPDILHEPVMGELAQYCWKNKVATIHHAADLSPANPFVPRRSGEPFTQPRDYVARGGQLPRVTDSMGDGELPFTPLGTDADLPAVTSLGQRLPEQRTFGSGQPFSQTSFMGRTGTQMVAGPAGRQTVGYPTPGRLGNAPPTVSPDDDDIGDRPNVTVSLRQQLDPLINAIHQQTAALQTTLHETNQPTAGTATTVLPPSTDPAVMAVLHQLERAMTDIEHALRHQSWDKAMNEPPPAYHAKLDDLVAMTEKLDRTIGGVADQLNHVTHLSASHRSQVEAVQQQLAKYEQDTTQALTLLSASAQHQAAAVDARLLEYQTQLMNHVNTKTAHLLTQQEGALRPEDMTRALDQLYMEIGKSLQGMHQLLMEGATTQAGMMATLQQGQLECADALHMLEMQTQAAGAVDQTYLHSVLETVQQLNQSVTSMHTALETQWTAPANVSGQIPWQAIEQGVGSEAEATVRDAPSAPTPSVVTEGTTAATAHMADTVVQPGDPPPASIPIVGGGFRPPSMTSATGPPLPVPIPMDQATAPNVTADQAMPTNVDAVPANAPPHGQLFPSTTDPPTAAATGPLYTQQAYPSPQPAKPFPLFDPSLPLTDQTPALFTQYANLSKWKATAVHYIGAPNKQLFFAIRRTMNDPNPAQALALLKTRVLVTGMTKPAAAGQGGPTRGRHRPASKRPY